MLFEESRITPTSKCSLHGRGGGGGPEGKTEVNMKVNFVLNQVASWAESRV